MQNLSPRADNTLIVFALEAEAQSHFADLRTLFCGVGKINAAYKLTHGLTKWTLDHGKPPGLVINAGSAGSSTFPRHSVVNCTHFIQRDMDATGLSFAPYTTPFDPTPATLNNGLRCEPYPQATCGTGDHFDTSGNHLEWNVVDMEAFALAKVCHHEAIPFCCLKYITDGADDGAATSWEEALEAAALALRKAVDGVFALA